MEGGGATGGPAPFLLKTYEMVDDSSTDSIVSWSANNTSFVVWNPPDFATRLLPAYFKHNNFSSFIRQLNTYGFRKIDPERWEFSNDDFAKGKKHLLKNIHRRKPIHSHSHPPGSIPDPERSSIEEELDQLFREKTALEADLWRFKQQQSGTKVQLEDLELRLFGMEGRQLKMIAFLQRAVQNPKFVDNLISMAGAGSGSEDFTVATTIHKKRRLPGSSDYSQEAVDDSSFDNHTNITAKPDTGQVFNRDFSDKLKLELCPAISDTNLVSSSTHGSNEEDVRSLQWKQPDRVDCVSLVVPEQLELSDTGNSFCLRKNLLLPRLADEGEGIAACHLSLTLASSSMQVDISHHLEKSPNSGDQGGGATSEVRTLNTGRENELGRKNSELNERIANESGAANAQSLQGAAPSDKQVSAPPPGRVNDVFWEQFLTERPGSSDAKEASSSLRANPYDEQPELKKQSDDSVWRNKKDTEKLSL